MNREYALRTDAQAKAFLKLPTTDGVNLRENYINIMNAVAERLEAGVTALHLVGELDVPKLQSSLEYFLRISEEEGDAGVKGACVRVLKHKLDH